MSTNNSHRADEPATNPALNKARLELFPVDRYRVKRGDIDLGEFNVSERWNGMVVPTNDTGDKIVADANVPQPDAGFFSLFGDSATDMLQRASTSVAHVDLFKASTNILDQIKPTSKGEGDTP